jgi:alpha-L-rhamnosidase
MVDMGATTIWERWDGYVKGRGFQNPGMNSLNHWAFGSIGEWVWRELVGLNLDEEQPGYKHFVIHPRPCKDLTWVKAQYDSIRGRIASDWKLEGQAFSLRVDVPANTTATIFVPAQDAGKVTESGKPAAQAEGVKFVKMEDGNAVFNVVSGRYVFQSEVGR